jgi:Zn-dependent membrane protease YugP
LITLLVEFDASAFSAQLLVSQNIRGEQQVRRN